MKRDEATVLQHEMRRRLEDAGLVLGLAVPVEIVDFGLGRFKAQGLGIVVRVNTPEYCSKWLVLLPGQECPMHHHRLKKETFFTLSGTVQLWAESELIQLHPGQQYTLNPGVRHRFSSISGAVIEEVSTHDQDSDSYFDDPAIVRDPASQREASETGRERARRVNKKWQ